MRNRDVTLESSLPVVSENGLITNLAVDFSGAPSVNLPVNTIIAGVGNLVDTSSVQTLTNKTLANPTTITGAVISGSTIGTSTVNGVTLSSTGSASLFLTQAGTYVAVSGSGTVTSVSVVTSQGVSGTVATATTTPAITLTLGALTGVTSVNGLVITANTGVITTGTWNGTTIAVANGGTGITSFGAGIATFLGTPSSANLATAITDETGSGLLVFGTNPTIVKPVMNARNQTAQTYSPAGAGTATLDLSLADQHDITMPAGNITIALSNDTNNQIFSISITQDATGSRTVTWFTTIRWAGGSPPTLTTTASKRDRFVFIRTGSGTYDGLIAGQNI